ncbi:hypothetical protein RJ640_021466 [Escallonia rubra]|uniref:Nucleolar protein 56 n=1 Tax=Escallonia rubra TaxID=112253 RepID=A0AA88U7W3_9ASTE|nr:hypothetical protein RJ640_021466 [Escallonia rubra]
MSGGLYLLYESASGYASFHSAGLDEIGQDTEAVRNSVADINRFGKVVKLVAFNPFESALDALTQCNQISEGHMTDELRNFLERTLPKVKEGKKPKFSIGVAEPKLGSDIYEVTKVPCQSNAFILELLRGVRLHFDQFLKILKPGDLEKAQLGLGHSYSRAKVKFNVNRNDNMVIQAISCLDFADKTINTSAMRFREAYSWHFPELVKIISDIYLYAKVANFVGNKLELSEDQIPAITEIVGDEEKAKEIVEAAKASMGQDLSPVDFIILKQLAETVIKAAELRKRQYDYLVSKMNDVAPNLAALIGEVIGARLISQAGSLTNLAKSPSSTIQILGAEKALFRALKTRGNTPKYGLIFNSSFIGRASARNKGRMARYLANKCSIAARVDCFLGKSLIPFLLLFQPSSDLSLVMPEENTTAFGEKLREQVEERLEFYEKGVAPSKNIDVMKAAIKKFIKKDAEVNVDESSTEPEVRKIKKSKSNVAAAADGETMAEDKQVAATNRDASEKKKKKKEKRKLDQDAEAGLDRANKKKKKSKA